MMSPTTQREKIHPHKLLLWIAIASLIMMFGGWTSGFLVRKSQGLWLKFTMPLAFWISSAVVIMSSVTIHYAVKHFKERKMKSYRWLISMTAILGFLFMVLQLLGFYEMHQAGVKLASNGEGVSGSFVWVISMVHLLHMLGGVIALIIVFISVNLRRQKKMYSSNSMEILSTYWHFVDVLWIYLFLFFYFKL